MEEAVTNEQIAAIEVLLKDQTGTPVTLEVPIEPVTTTYGQIMLTNGTALAGSWTYHHYANVLDFTDDKGVRWWFDVDKVLGFSLPP